MQLLDSFQVSTCSQTALCQVYKQLGNVKEIIIDFLKSLFDLGLFDENLHVLHSLIFKVA